MPVLSRHSVPWRWCLSSAVVAFWAPWHEPNRSVRASAPRERERKQACRVIVFLLCRSVAGERWAGGWYSVAPMIGSKGTCFPRLLQSSFLGISSSSCYGEGLHPSQRFFLFSSGKGGSPARKYVASRSGVSLSTYVVLSARYLNSNVHVRSP